MTPNESSNELLMLLLEKGHTLLPVETALANLMSAKGCKFEMFSPSHAPNPLKRSILVASYELDGLYRVQVMFYAYDPGTDARFSLLSFGRVGDWKTLNPGDDPRYDQLLQGSIKEVMWRAVECLNDWEGAVRTACMHDRKKRRADGDIFA